MFRGRLAMLAFMVLGLVWARPADSQAIASVGGGLTTVSGFFGTLPGFNFGGGVEALIHERVGASGEFGYLGNATSLLQVVSANGVYRFWTKPGTDRNSVFATGGYTHLSSGEGAFNAWNIGAGFETFHGRKGVRFEVRDHVRPDSRGTVHYLTIRVAASFR